LEEIMSKKEYKPLITCIDMEKIKELQENYIFNLSAFIDKYEEQCIAKIVKVISDAPLDLIWRASIWTISFSFLKVDVLKLDKDYKFCISSVSKLLKNVCEKIEVEFISVKIEKTDTEKMFFSLEMKNPLLDKLEK
jgi:hypothetical protein